MSLFSERKYNRVMVFIDYRNVFDSIDDSFNNVTRLDLYRMTEILVGSRDLVGAYIFDARDRIPTDDDILKYNRWKENGFRVITRESMVHHDGKTVQKEIDVAIACEMLEHALMNHYDVAILVSGDRDFVPAIQRVQAAGKRVETASFTNPMSAETRRASDVWYVLDNMPILSLSSPCGD